MPVRAQRGQRTIGAAERKADAAAAAVMSSRATDGVRPSSVLVDAAASRISPASASALGDLRVPALRSPVDRVRRMSAVTDRRDPIGADVAETDEAGVRPARGATPRATGLPARVQRSTLTIGPADDPAERQADAAAAAVMSSLAAGGGRPSSLYATASRISPASRSSSARDLPVPTGAPRSPVSRVRRTPALPDRGDPIGADVADRITSARRGGRPMPRLIRRRMEQAFGAELGTVRVHADGEADSLNRAVGAQAFTVGSDVFFSRGAYDLASSGGQHLLAHELAHVVQQAPGVRCARTHDYDDRRVQELHNNPTYTAQVVAAQAHLAGAPVDVAMANGATSVMLNQIPAARQRVRAALLAAGVPNNQTGQVLGQQYELDAGVHDITIWSRPQGGAAVAPVRLLTFQVRVFPHGGQVADAVNADAAFVNRVNHLTFDQATSRPFRVNHVIDPVPLGDEEAALVRIAIGRQKASTLLQLTPAAEAGIVQEVRAIMLNGQGTTKQSFTTGQHYPIIDIDPAVDDFKRFDAQLQFALFHNPNVGLWQMSHLEAAVNRQNVVTVANLTGSAMGAVHNAGVQLAFQQPVAGGPAPNIARSDKQTVSVQSAIPLRSMSIRIDCTENDLQSTGDWKSANKTSGVGVVPETWTFVWAVPANVPPGRYSIWAEGRDAATNHKTKGVFRQIILT